MKKILGIMTFGDQVEQTEALSMMIQFTQSGVMNWTPLMSIAKDELNPCWALFCPLNSAN